MDYAAHERSLGQTEREIAQEKASALSRISRRLQVDVEGLEVAYAALARGRAPERRRELATTVRERRATAKPWRWYLMVQRESLGLRDPRPADEIVPLPTPATAP